jgi:hypothetical protein
VRALGVLRAVLAVDSEALLTTVLAVSEVRYSSHSFSFADEVDLVRRNVANVEIVGSIPIIRSSVKKETNEIDDVRRLRRACRPQKHK